MRWFVLGAMVSLAGCGSWHKPGASEAQFHQDKFACESRAMQAYPQNMQPMGQGYQGPSQTNCTGYGNNLNCTTTPGRYVAPAVQDTNSIGRAGAFNSCMRGQGWTFN